MTNISKTLTFFVIGLLVLLVGMALVIPRLIDPQIVIQQVNQQLKDRYQRELQVSGKVGFSFFPSLGIDLNGVSLSEPMTKKNAGEFLRAEQLHLALEVVPLFQRKVALKALGAKGVSVEVVKYAEGRYNFSDLVENGKTEVPAEQQNDPPSSSAEYLKGLSIQSIDLSQLTVRYRDEVSGQSIVLDEVSFNTGKVASGEFTSVSFSGNAAVNPQKLSFQVKVNGDVKPQFDAPSQIELRDLNVTLEAKMADAGAGQIELQKLTGITQGELLGQLQIKGNLDQSQRQVALNLASPLKANLVDQLVELSELKGTVNLKDSALPKKALDANIGGRMSANLKQQKVLLALRTAYESTNLDLQAGLHRFENPELSLNLKADVLDIDALFPPKPKAEQPKALDAGKAKGQSNTDVAVDLSPLKGLNATVKLAVGQLTAQRLKLADLKADASIANGVLNVAPFSANAYSGSVNGSITANANSNSFAVKQQLNGINVEPLLKDLLNKDILAGKGDVLIDIATSGNKVSQLKKGLTGPVALNLKDGAVKGYNIAEKLRTVKASLGGSNVSATADKNQKTDFSSLSVSFNFKDGVGTSNDLNLMAPLIRVGGQGTVDVGRDSLDYLAKATLVATSTGQGGKTLDSGLNGVTVPVRVYGPFTQVQWELKLGDMIKDSAKEAAKEKLAPKVEEKKQELKDKAKEKLFNFLSR